MKKLVTLILLAGILTVLPYQVYALDLGNFGKIVSVVSEHEKTKKELQYYNSDGRADLGNHFREKYGVDNNPEKNELIQRVSKNLLNSISKTEPVTPEYSIFINQKKEFNAFCSLGHNVSVNTGAINFLNYNEDELAFLLSHEFRHGQGDHSIKSYNKTVPLTVLQQIFAGNNARVDIMTKVAGNYLVAKEATLPQEWEADNYGFTYAVDAGYNPGAGAALWTRVKEKFGDNHQNFFGDILNPNDHPTNGQRIKNYDTKLTEYSNNVVKFNGSTLFINGKNWYSPEKTGSMSAQERGYLIAGMLARVYHSSQAPSAGVEDNQIVITYGSARETISAIGNEDAQAIAARFNQIK